MLPTFKESKLFSLTSYLYVRAKPHADEDDSSDGSFQVLYAVALTSSDSRRALGRPRPTCQTSSHNRRRALPCADFHIFPKHSHIIKTF